ncbi:glycosyl transferase family 25 [Buttiauxella sp. BIGb0471]|uniref:glycosyltransferase family 25 protein n=1 Tax=Buttiauxella sp. BIGb0471 TaxID=2940597 RepID=UPI00216755C6|nr:glycosyltransferase family 25 protein [Buttiauxella sp. BIGb0471]MCS3604767.1 glycosyl transferase family 25 [Buttiauxella sp. BIGb0471]
MKTPVYVISLLRDEERRNRINKEFSSLGIEFRFFDAVDAKDYNNKNIIEKMRANGVGPEMTDGEIACALSHQFVYHDMILNSCKWAVILEDDVIVDNKFKKFLSSLDEAEQSKLRLDNLYLLGGQKGLHEYPVLGLSLFNSLNVAGVTFRRVNYNKNKIRRTCCYLMNSKMAQQLIDLTASYGTYRADSWQLMNQKNIINDFYLNEFILHPILNEFNSHLEGERILISKIKKPRSQIQKRMKLFRSWFRVFFFYLLK